MAFLALQSQPLHHHLGGPHPAPAPPSGATAAAYGTLAAATTTPASSSDAVSPASSSSASSYHTHLQQQQQQQLAYSSFAALPSSSSSSSTIASSSSAPFVGGVGSGTSGVPLNGGPSSSASYQRPAQSFLQQSFEPVSEDVSSSMSGGVGSIRGGGTTAASAGFGYSFLPANCYAPPVQIPSSSVARAGEVDLSWGSAQGEAGTQRQKQPSRSSLDHQDDDEEDQQAAPSMEVKKAGSNQPKHRRRTTRAQFKTLEMTFQTTPKPSQAERKALGEELDMSPRAVQVWFQNRRAKAKNQKLKAEAKCVAGISDASSLHYQQPKMMKGSSHSPPTAVPSQLNLQQQPQSSLQRSISYGGVPTHPHPRPPSRPQRPPSDSSSSNPSPQTPRQAGSSEPSLLGGGVELLTIPPGGVKATNTATTKKPSPPAIFALPQGQQQKRVAFDSGTRRGSLPVAGLSSSQLAALGVGVGNVPSSNSATVASYQQRMPRIGPGPNRTLRRGSLAGAVGAGQEERAYPGHHNHHQRHHSLTGAFPSSLTMGSSSRAQPSVVNYSPHPQSTSFTANRRASLPVVTPSSSSNSASPSPSSALLSYQPQQGQPPAYPPPLGGRGGTHPSSFPEEDEQDLQQSPFQQPQQQAQSSSFVQQQQQPSYPPPQQQALELELFAPAPYQRAPEPMTLTSEPAPYTFPLPANALPNALVDGLPTTMMDYEQQSQQQAYAPPDQHQQQPYVFPQPYTFGTYDTRAAGAARMRDSADDEDDEDKEALRTVGIGPSGFRFGTAGDGEIGATMDMWDPANPASSSQADGPGLGAFLDGRRASAPASLLQNFSSLHMLQPQQQASPPPPQQQLYTLHESSRQQQLQQSQELGSSALSSGGFDPSYLQFTEDSFGVEGFDESVVGDDRGFSFSFQ